MGVGASLYDPVVKCAFGALRGLCRLMPKGKAPKIRRFIDLQKNWEDRLADLETIAAGKNGDNESRTIWIHASSLGEYQIAHPVISLLKKEGIKTGNGDKRIPCKVVVTLFSSTGIDSLKGKEATPGFPDIILPLPLDTRENAAKFIDTLKPDIAIFMVSEYWPNYLDALRKRNIPILLYSALFRNLTRNPAGAAFRNAMVRRFDMVAVHDTLSRTNLLKAGCRNVLKLADPLFDNALSKREEEFHDEAIEKFIAAGKGPVLVAGSIHIDRDLALTAAIARRFPDTRIIVVPHETTPKDIRNVMREIPGEKALHSKAGEITDWSRIHVLVIDSVGMLAKIYRYGRGAYVGGGFTHLLHSVIEPMVYGIPVSYGPVTGRKYVTAVMEEIGIGTKTADEEGIVKWWESVVNPPKGAAKIREKSLKTCKWNRGGAAEAIGLIEKMLSPQTPDAANNITKRKN